LGLGRTEIEEAPHPKAEQLPKLLFHKASDSLLSSALALTAGLWPARKLEFGPGTSLETRWSIHRDFLGGEHSPEQSPAA
jgi:hypothetical protein